MRLIDADALLNDSSIVYHTEFGDAVVDVEDIEKAPTIDLPLTVKEDSMNKSEKRDSIIIDVVTAWQSVVSNNSLVLVDLITYLALNNKIDYKEANHWFDMFIETNREVNEKLEKLRKEAEEVENE